MVHSYLNPDECLQLLHNRLFTVGSHDVERLLPSGLRRTDADWPTLLLEKSAEQPPPPPPGEVQSRQTSGETHSRAIDGVCYTPKRLPMPGWRFRKTCAHVVQSCTSLGTHPVRASHPLGCGAFSKKNRSHTEVVVGPFLISLYDFQKGVPLCGVVSL